MTDYRVHFVETSEYVSTSARNKHDAARHAAKCLRALMTSRRSRRRPLTVAKVIRAA